MDSTWHRHQIETLTHLDGRDQRRTLRVYDKTTGSHVQWQGRRLVNMSSNDTLGLSQHPALIKALQEATARYGCGAGASRLVCGTSTLHQDLESHLALFKGTEAALSLGAGFQTNVSVLAALIRQVDTQHPPLAFVDRLVHASLYDGLKMAGLRPIRFRHNDMAHLADLLTRHAAHRGPRFILTESVFSMDGDRADLPTLVTLAEKHHALLYVDEAHATGLLGPQGRGLCANPDVKGRIGLVMGTFSKALGGYGSFVATTPLLKEWLVQHCRGLIYSTALPPPVIAAAQAALNVVPTLDDARQQIERSAHTVRHALKKLGYNTGTSDTHIIPVLIGSDHETVTLAHHLEDAGILAVAIRPPTVPPKTGRIRLAISALHTPEHLDQVCDAFHTFSRYGAS